MVNAADYDNDYISLVYLGTMRHGYYQTDYLRFVHFCGVFTLEQSCFFVIPTHASGLELPAHRLNMIVSLTSIALNA